MTSKNIISHKRKSSILSVGLTSIIVGILIFAGPASALQVYIQGLQNTYHEGEDITFTATLGVEPEEQVNIQTVKLYLSGEEICEFDPSGAETCEGVDVERISSGASYGYGYGYQYGYGYGYRYGYGYGNNGELTYNITIDHDLLEVGNHTLVLQAQTPAKNYEATQNITIEAQGGGNNTVTLCHIPPGNSNAAHTITVGAPAVQAHLNHGDYLGPCNNTTGNNNGNNGNGNGNNGNGNN